MKSMLRNTESLATDTNIFIANQLQWADINFTLHGLLHHSLELFVTNGGWSIGTLNFDSEETIETNNKFVRRYMERFARLFEVESDKKLLTNYCLKYFSPLSRQKKTIFVKKRPMNHISAQCTKHGFDDNRFGMKKINKCRILNNF